MSSDPELKHLRITSAFGQNHSGRRVEDEPGWVLLAKRALFSKIECAAKLSESSDKLTFLSEIVWMLNKTLHKRFTRTLSKDKITPRASQSILERKI